MPTRRLVPLLLVAFASGAAAGAFGLRPEPRPPLPWNADLTLGRMVWGYERTETTLTPTRVEIDGQMEVFEADRGPAPNRAVYTLTLAGGRVKLWAVERRRASE